MAFSAAQATIDLHGVAAMGRGTASVGAWVGLENAIRSASTG